MLIEKIKAEHLQARKDNNKNAKNALGTLIGQLQNLSDGKLGSLTDEKIIKAVKSMVVNLDEMIKLSDGERKAAAEDEKAILSKYIPESLSEEQTRDLIVGIIDETQATTMKDMGKIMVHLKRVGTGVDMGLANKIIKEILQ
jgi:uncharacterized protein YqeY